MAKKLERKQMEMEFLSEKELLKADRRIADREATLAEIRGEIGNGIYATGGTGRQYGCNPAAAAVFQEIGSGGAGFQIAA